MRWNESELACFAVLALFWKQITKFECGEFWWKTKTLTTQASRLQQQAQIQISNLNDRMPLLRIYLILKQWWSARQYEEVRKEIVKNIMSVMWNIFDQFLCLCFPVIWIMKREFFSALIFSIGCLALLFQTNTSFLLIFSDIDNR